MKKEEPRQETKLALECSCNVFLEMVGKFKFLIDVIEILIKIYTKMIDRNQGIDQLRDYCPPLNLTMIDKLEKDNLFLNPKNA